jgi:hypothetical protein
LERSLLLDNYSTARNPLFYHFLRHHILSPHSSPSVVDSTLKLTLVLPINHLRPDNERKKEWGKSISMYYRVTEIYYGSEAFWVLPARPYGEDKLEAAQRVGKSRT